MNVYCELKKICPSLDSLDIGGGWPIRKSLGFEYDYEYMAEQIVKQIKAGCKQKGVQEVVIAEISPAGGELNNYNPNVFYELGYAHALGKPTILLARRGSKLPFDINSYRVVFYDDTIGGKAEVEENLRKHLAAITGR